MPPQCLAWKAPSAEYRVFLEMSPMSQPRNKPASSPKGAAPQPSDAPPDHVGRDAAPEELANPRYWEDIYESEDPPGFDLGEPHPEFAHFLVADAPPRLPPGRVAVLGCGFGHDALAFARAGHEVTAIDYARQAVARTEHNAREAGLAVQTLQADLFTLPSWTRGHFDCIVEHTCFCAIHPTRRADYALAAHAMLRDGGQFLGIFYYHRRIGGPPYDTTPEQVRATFEPWFDCRVLSVATRSVERRAGNELFGRFWKRETRSSRVATVNEQ